jgi:hypothetical protein
MRFDLKKFTALTCACALAIGLGACSFDSVVTGIDAGLTTVISGLNSAALAKLIQDAEKLGMTVACDTANVAAYVDDQASGDVAIQVLAGHVYAASAADCTKLGGIPNPL